MQDKEGGEEDIITDENPMPNGTDEGNDINGVGVNGLLHQSDMQLKREANTSSRKDATKSNHGGANLGSDAKSKRQRKQTVEVENLEDEQEDDEPVRKRSRRSAAQEKPKQPNDMALEPHEKPKKSKAATSVREKTSQNVDTPTTNGETSGAQETAHSRENASSEKPSASKKGKPKTSVLEQANENDIDAEKASSDAEMEDSHPEEEAKLLSHHKSQGKDPYPDWKPGEPVPYAALCTTFSLIEMTTKRLIITAHCTQFLRQVLRLTPKDLLPTIQLMINKLAADYAGIELGIGESLIMKAIGESTGRSLQIIKADQKDIGDLGLVAAKSRSNQPTMFKPKPLTIKGVLEGLMNIATISGDGSQGRKVAGIKKLLSAADVAMAGKGSKGIDVTKDKGGASESKFIIRFLEGKLRLGLAEKTVIISLANAMVSHEVEQKSKKVASAEKLAEGQAILKIVYR